jgi:Lrp/AsnC family transcriptional regulator, leucine-responsive regulatory protein
MSSKRTGPLVALDDIDLRILRHLQQDGRMSYVGLSQRVHLSAPQCYRRITRLEKAGIIDRYVAVVNAQLLGFDVMAFVNITLDKAQYLGLEELQTVLSSFPEVLECQAITGDHDYLLKIVAHNLEAYASFLNTKLMRVPGVVSVKSSVRLGEVKFTTALPVD